MKTPPNHPTPSTHFKCQHPPQQQTSSRISLYYQLCQKIQLSKREQELLEWLSFGYSYQEMASGINLSVNTIKKYFFVLREKFNANDNSHLLCITFRGGLLSSVDSFHNQ
ncbi:MAG: helix-turn-helix domain-containing protein [Cyanobacteria bacterium P01_G01_bin.49]